MKDVYKVPAHQYNFAGFMNKVAGDPDKDGNIKSGAFAGMSGSVASGLGALGSAVGGMAGSAIAGGRTSPAGDIIGGLGDIASAIPGPWGAVAGAGLKVIGGLTNAAFGVKLNQENINAVNNNIASMNNFQSNASSFDDLAQNINSQPTAMNFNQKFIGKNGWFNKGATKKYNQLLAQQDAAQQFVDNSIDNNMNNLVNTQSQNLLANYAAKGGPLETHGSDWSTGLNYIGTGGSHEQNPNGGIQQGIAPDGLPNLVEEGEVIWNGDYVFSKRLKVPKAVRNKYKLRGTKPMSFADAALEFNKEMEERPNDPISKRGRDGMLAKLADVQEEKRAKIAAKEQTQQAAMTDMMGIPQDQMAMQEQPAQDDVMSEANQEELARQEIMQGMQQPMVEGYAAKGGPIGHKYDTAGWLDSYTNWWNSRHSFNPSVAQLASDRLDALYPERLYRPPFPSTASLWNRDLNYTKDGNNLSKDVMNWFAQQARLIGGDDIRFNKASSNNDFLNAFNSFIDGLDANTVGEGTLSDRVERVLTKANKGAKGPISKGIQSLYDTYGKEGNDARMFSYLDSATTPRILPQTLLNPATLTNPTSKYPILNAANNLNATIQNSKVQPAETEDTTKSNYPWQGYLRYAPAIGSAIGVFSDLMGWTNKPDYSAADALLNASTGVRDVSFRPIGDYAQYRPVDTRFTLNALNGAAGSTRRGIMNTSAGNRGTAMAGMLAADNNYMNSIGNTLFTAENANYDRYLKALAHNADINKFNSEGFLKAAMANQGAGEVRAKYAAMAADARQKALALASANRSANLTNLFDNLGNIGIDALNRADARWLARQWPGGLGQPTLNANPTRYIQGVDGNMYPVYSKHGGRIRKRRRGRVI